MVIGMFLLAHPSHVYSQDARPKQKKEKVKNRKPKGEKAGRKNPQVRETRFKMRTKKGDKPRNRDSYGKKVKRNQRSAKPVQSGVNYNPYYGRSKFSPQPKRFSSKSKRIRTVARKGERSTGKDISGRKIRPTTTQRAPGGNMYSAPNPYVARSKKSRESRAKYAARSIRSRSASDRKTRLAQSGKRIRSPRTAGNTLLSRRGQNAIRSTSPGQGNRAKSFSKGRNPVKSISGNIRNRRPANPFATANTKRKRRGEVSTNRDIAGKKLKKKRSPGQQITTTSPSPYIGRRTNNRTRSNQRQIARNSKSINPSTKFAKTSFGGVRTSGRKGEIATNRSSSGKKLRTKNMRSSKPLFGGGVPGPRYLSQTKKGEGGYNNRRALRNIRSSKKPREKPGLQTGGFRTGTAKGERSTNKDIAGRRLRTRNYRSRSTQITGPIYNPYYSRKNPEEGKHPIKTKGGRKNLSVSGGLRNNGGRSIEGKGPGKGTISGGRFTGNIKAKRKPQGGGSISGQLRNNGGRSLKAQRPGKGTISGGRFTGNIKPKKRLQGGGSISGQLRNNGGRSLKAQPPGKGTISGGRFTGNIKAKRKPQGGGSISERLRNNGGRSLKAQRPGKGTISGGRFTGNLRAKRLPKGGGSISGGLRNNRGRPLEGKAPGKGTIAGGKFTGRIRSFREMKGGGSISFQLRNNKGRPLKGRPPGRGTILGGRYLGNLKLKKPAKGGGSISGGLRNNNGRALAAKKPGRGTIKGGRFQGELRAKRNPQGGGSISARLRNNRGYPLKGQKPGKGTIAGGRFSGNIKMPKSLRNRPALARYQGELRAKRSKAPGKGTIAGARYHGNLRLGRKSQRSPGTRYRGKDYLFDLTPGFGYQGEHYRGDLRLARKPGYKKQGGDYKGSLRLPRKIKYSNEGLAYKGNMRIQKGYSQQKAGPALKKTRSWYQYIPGFTLRADKYTGSFRYRTPSRKDTHISSSFTGRKPGNAKEENEKLFKFKIWWAKLFRNETPHHQRGRQRKARYDKGESKIWYK